MGNCNNKRRSAITPHVKASSDNARRSNEERVTGTQEFNGNQINTIVKSLPNTVSCL